ncbi:hypothetical protein ACA910_022273 [Epithemia clementina (nom. ined.)]
MCNLSGSLQPSPTISSSGTTQSCQDLSNFHKNMKWETLTLETFKDAQYFEALWHAWKTDVYVNKTYKEHDQAQWELGQVQNASPAAYPFFSAIVTVGHHLNKESTYISTQNHIKLGLWEAGIGNMQLSGLVHIHKSDDPHNNWLFDEGPTALPKLVVDTQEQVPDFHCVKVLNTKDSGVHQHVFQGQDDYDHFTSYEIVDSIFDTYNSSQGYFDAKSTVIGSGTTKHNDLKSQVGYQIQEFKEAMNKMILPRTMERLIGQLEQLFLLNLSLYWTSMAIIPTTLNYGELQTLQ